MKIFYRSTLPVLAAVLFILVSCSPKYGAHFAPSKQTPAVTVQEQDKSTAPLVTEAPAAQPVSIADRAAETGATAVVTDQKVIAEAPAVPVNTAKQQRKVLREFKKKLKGMSDEERQAFKDQVLNQLKEQQRSMKLTSPESAPEQDGPTGEIALVLLIILAIVLPPLAVFLHEGEINTKFWISLVLSLLFWVPGIIYAFLVIFDVV